MPFSPAWPSAEAQQRFFQSLLSQPGRPPSLLGRDCTLKASAYDVFQALLGQTQDDHRHATPPEKISSTTVVAQVERDVPSRATVAPPVSSPVASDVTTVDQQRWTARLSQGLTKTRGRLVSRLTQLLGSGAKIDAALFEDMESELLAADVGIEATDRLMQHVQTVFKQNPSLGSQELYEALRSEMQNILAVPGENPLVSQSTPLPHKPFVLLVIGVNGVGKTTTIGKIAKAQQGLGRKVMLAAGDTFRAAAIDQIKRWGERLSVPVIAQQPGADSAAVIFDAFRAAQARNVDILIADTAGRLHTQNHLMDELRKVKRVLQKNDPLAPHAVLLVLDAGNGQNALNQARVFHDVMAVSGIALTKLDGTARGGISFAICETLQLPLWFVGVGEQAEDLRPFVPEDFVNALLSKAS